MSGEGSTPKLADGYYHINGSTVTVELEHAEGLKSVGGSVKLKDEKLGKGIIVVRVDDDTYGAYDIACTHRGVEVEYQSDNKQLRCASFGHTTYDLDGNSLKGPGKAPLKKYTATVQDNLLTIKI